MQREVPDEAAIRALTGGDVYERGCEVHRRKAVSNLVAREGELTAEVQGTDIAPYRVTVRLADGEVADAQCSCPVGSDGACKHVVATLLSLATDPGAVSERPPMRQLLSALDRDGLLDLLLKRVAVDPAFSGWIEAEIAATVRAGGGPVDAEPVAAQARSVLGGRYRQRNYWDDYRARGDISELEDLVGKAVPFLEAGDGRNALRVLEAVAGVFVTEWIEFASGSDEHMYEMFDDLGRMMAEAALMSDLGEAERSALAATVRDWQDDLAEYGVEEGFGPAIHALRSGWDDPKLRAVLDGAGGPWPEGGGPEAATAFGGRDDGLEEDADWLERQLIPVRLRVLDAAGRSDAYLALARASGAHASAATMLARLGRNAEAVALAAESFTLPDEALALAEALTETGARAEALGIAERGLRLGAAEDGGAWHPGRSVVPLARWLREQAVAGGRPDLALTAARTAFEHTHERADFRAVRPLAGPDWDGVRAGLIAHLIAAERSRDRAEILLDEGLISEAVASVGEARDFVTDEAVILRLMEAAQASHPDWVIRVAERNAEAIMDRGAAGGYERAATWLKRAAMAYDAAGRIDEWSVRIEGLIETHRRKYKLRPLLEALRFDA